MKPEYNNTLSDDDDLYIRININKESLKGNDNNYTSSNTNNNNNMSYYSSALSLEKDLYSSSKNEFNLIESQINKIISSNQSFSSKISSSIPSKSVQSDDFKSKISKLSTDFLFNDEEDDEDEKEDENNNSEYDQTTNDDNDNFVGIDLDSVISSDHSYLKTIKKLLKKSRKIRNKENSDNNEEEEKEDDDDDEDDEDENEDEDEDNDEDDEDEDEDEDDEKDEDNESEKDDDDDVEEEDDDDKDEDEEEEEVEEEEESHHSYNESQQMNFNSNLSLVTDSAQNSKNVKKKRVGNKNKKRKNNRFEKESTKSVTSFGNQTYSQYSLSGLSSQSTIKSLIAKNKLLMEIEKLKELNSKLSKSSISNNNEQVSENGLEISETNDDEDENNNVAFSMADDQITNLSSPRKSDYENDNDNDNDNITVREQIDNTIPVESVVSSSTIKKNGKEQLLEDLKSLSSLNLHHSIKSKSRTGSPKRKALSSHQDKISIRIIQDEQEDIMTKGESDSEKLSKHVISSHNTTQKSINSSLAERNDVCSNKTKDNFSKSESVKNKLNKGKQKESTTSNMNNTYSNKNDQKTSTYSENKAYSKSFNNTNSFNLNTLSNDRASKLSLNNNSNLSSNKDIEESHLNDIKIEIKNNNPINITSSASTTNNSSSVSDSDSTVDDSIFGNASEKQQMKMEFSKKWKEVNDRLNAKNKSSERSINNQSFKSSNSHGIKKKYSNEIKENLRKFSSRSSETASIIANSNVIYNNDGLSGKYSFTTNENKIKQEQLTKQNNSNSPRSDGSITPRASLANIKIRNYSIPDPKSSNYKIETNPSTSNINAPQINNPTTTEIPISQQPPTQPQSQPQLQPQLQPQPIYSDKDTIDIYQTFKNEKPFINMRIKKQPIDSSIENNMISHSEIYSLLTSQLKDLSQQNKEKDDKIQNLYHQLQQEKRMTELLKSKIHKLRRENNKINERNHRNFQKFIIKSDEHLYNTEKEYLKRIRELELELYKERLNNKSANKASSNQIKKLNDELKNTNQEYQKNKKELNLKQNLQLDALYKEFAQLKKKINTERQERKDSDLDYIFKILNEKNTYTNDYIDKLMNKIK